MSEQTDEQEPLAPAEAGGDDFPKMLYCRDDFDPVALSGTTNAPFAQRLAYQVSACQYLPAGLGVAGQAGRVTEAVSTLKALAPANAVEAILAAQAAAAHTASLDLLQSAMAGRRGTRETEACARQHARLSGLLLRQLDQLTRMRGRQRQTIRIEHVRVVEDGTVTVRQEEERVRG